MKPPIGRDKLRVAQARRRVEGVLRLSFASDRARLDALLAAVERDDAPVANVLAMAALQNTLKLWLADKSECEIDRSVRFVTGACVGHE